MKALCESPWYQEIISEGEKRGKCEQMLANVEMTLEMKFGSEGLQLMPQSPKLPI